jgi:hypothetical protein
MTQAVEKTEYAYDEPEENGDTMSPLTKGDQSWDTDQM